MYKNLRVYNQGSVPTEKQKASETFCFYIEQCAKLLERGGAVQQLKSYGASVHGSDDPHMERMGDSSLTERGEGRNISHDDCHLKWLFCF